jgi:mono/diheme cytochrome c family protein
LDSTLDMERMLAEGSQQQWPATLAIPAEGQEGKEVAVASRRIVPTTLVVVLAAIALSVCRPLFIPAQAVSHDELVARGEVLFFEETFAGNGRTCGTCHPATNNFTIDPAFIAGLPDDDPLFVAEFVPALRRNFENPRLMREFGLILENTNGFADLANDFTMRGVPHVLAQRTSVDSPGGPRTGWSGDGAPGDGSLRAFATGAVVQHFTRTLAREPGVDFRLPTEEELDAIEAFMLSLGRQEDLALPIPLRGTVPARGQQIFLDDTLGKCNLCHLDAGANAAPGGQDLGNGNFDTGVELLPDQPLHLADELVPPDDGFGSPGDGTFNTPPLVEAADTGPFFHNNSIETVEGAVAFYNSLAFDSSPAGRFLAANDPDDISIQLEPTQVVAVAAFLRVLNALENIREAEALLDVRLGDASRETRGLVRAISETDDGAAVLAGAGLHPRAVRHLVRARTSMQRATRSFFFRHAHLRSAARSLQRARGDLVER